jgi:hypothetical protein
MYMTSPNQHGTPTEFGVPWLPQTCIVEGVTQCQADMRATAGLSLKLERVSVN